MAILRLWFTNQNKIMDRKQQNRYDMFVATHRFLHEHQQAWASDAMMLAATGKLRALIDSIAAANHIVVNTEGPAQRTQRGDILDDAIDALMTVSAVTRNWAADLPEETILCTLVSTPGYELLEMSLANRLERMKAMLEACEATAARIPDNPLGADVYRKARACLTLYMDLDGAARNSDAQRTAAIARLKVLHKDGPALLERIDAMLRKFKSKQPELHVQYKAVRKILDLGGSSKRSAGKAVRKAQKAAKKAQDAARIAAEAARIADEEAKNRASLAELKKSLAKGTGASAPAKQNADDSASPVIPLPPPESTQVG